MDEGEQQKPLDLVESHRNSLEKTFSHYLKEFISKDNPQIVSVGSGFGYEVGALKKTYPNMSYLGIEIDEKYQLAVSKVNGDISGDIRFITADARDSGSFGDHNWDVVLVRHPQVHGSRWLEMGNSQDWEKILHNSIQAVSEDGIIVITSDTEGEVAIIKRILLKSNIDIVVSEENKFPSKDSHHDSFILIGKKHDI